MCLLPAPVPSLLVSVVSPLDLSVVSALPAAPGGVVAVAGSRSLPAGAAGAVGGVARALAAAGFSVAVGCCVGADSAVLSSVPPAALRVFAAFGCGGVGACAVSAVSAVAAVAASGGSVAWWAGGGSAAPLRARLAARSAAVVSAASVGAVVFFASPVSRGSFLAARLAARRSLPVLAVPFGFSGAVLPLLASGGVWLAVGGGVWRWCPPAGLF